MKVINPFEYQDKAPDYYIRLKGEGYVLTEDLRIPLPQLADDKRDENLTIQNGFGHLTKDGSLVLLSGFFWNGSNCSIDAVAGLLAALVHDALSEMCNEYKYKDRRFSSRQADKIYAEILKTQGPDARAWYHYPAVRLGSFWRWIKNLFVLAAVATLCGCVRVQVAGDWVHRGQVVNMPEDGLSETVNVENLQEGGSLEGSLNGIKK
jgi:hypothetical protein